MNADRLFNTIIAVGDSRGLSENFIERLPYDWMRHKRAMTFQLSKKFPARCESLKLPFWPASSDLTKPD